VLVGGRGPDVDVDDEQHGVGQVDGDLGLHGDGLVDADGVGLPPAGVDEGEAASAPLGLVRDAVARHAGLVLDDGLAPPEDAVDHGALADVRTTDDGEHRQRRGVGEGVGVPLAALEDVDVFIVELVVGQAGPQSAGALLGVLVRHRLDAVDHVVVELGVLVVVCHGGS
jgi:hypothetical protein